MNIKNKAKKISLYTLCVSALLLILTQTSAFANFSVDGYFSEGGPGNPINSSSYELPDPDEVLQRQGKAANNSIDPSESLRVLVWNVYKGQREKLLPDLTGFKQKVDLFLLQESMQTKNFEETFNQFSKLAWHTAISFYDDAKGTGVTTGTRFKSSSVEYIRSHAREPFIKTPKMIITLNIPIKNHTETMLIANIHGINFVGTKAFESHMDQLFKKISAHSGPIILGGDFNTWNSQRMDYLLNKAKQEQLLWLELENDTRKLTLDHLFARDVSVKTAAVLNRINSSDHYPLYLDVKVNTDDQGRLALKHVH